MAPVGTLCATEQYKMINIPYNLVSKDFAMTKSFCLSGKCLTAALQQRNTSRRNIMQTRPMPPHTGRTANKLLMDRQQTSAPSTSTEVTENHFGQQIPLCISQTKNVLPHLESPCSALPACSSLYPGTAEP